MPENGFSVTRILPYKDKIVDFVFIRENTCHWKLAFSHILCNESLIKVAGKERDVEWLAGKK